MDTRHTTTTHVILDPMAMLAELDVLASSPTRSHTFVEAEKVRALIYKHMRIVAASQVVSEEMMASVADPKAIEGELAKHAERQIAHEINDGPPSLKR